MLINNTWLYPIPAKNEINIVSGFQINDITIYDLNGREVKKNTHQGNEFVLDISKLQKGIYITDINTIRGRVSKKFIKK